MSVIPFCKAAVTGDEIDHVKTAIASRQLGGDGAFTKKCSAWFREYGNAAALLTPSCTHALEMAAFLINTKPGDEIIMPSYTFVSTANAFVLRGGKIVFVDVDPETINIDPKHIKDAITDRTTAIAPVHYAGMPCQMDEIMAIARAHDLFVIEDAAQGLMSRYDGKPLGTIGDFGAISFHTTKNFTSGGEGGLLFVNNLDFVHRAEVFREKGTDRSAFFRGDIDKYTWRDMGSSMLPSELQMAYLWGQLSGIEALHTRRLSIWNRYYDGLKGLGLQTSKPPTDPRMEHNGHIFFIMSPGDKQTYLEAFKARGIHATSHYEPLHEAEMGKKHGRVSGPMDATNMAKERLIRLPLYVSLTDDEVSHIITSAQEIFS
nr:dTDP-4-amino-4,6-dideoxygalactose transaminase [Algimonas arctica]